LGFKIHAFVRVGGGKIKNSKFGLKVYLKIEPQMRSAQRWIWRTKTEKNDLFPFLRGLFFLLPLFPFQQI
jgi:hypothetical protein